MNENYWAEKIKGNGQTGHQYHENPVRKTAARITDRLK